MDEYRRLKSLTGDLEKEKESCLRYCIKEVTEK